MGPLPAGWPPVPKRSRRTKRARRLRWRQAVTITASLREYASSYGYNESLRTRARNFHFAAPCVNRYLNRNAPFAFVRGVANVRHLPWNQTCRSTSTPVLGSGLPFTFPENAAVRLLATR